MVTHFCGVCPRCAIYDPQIAKDSEIAALRVRCDKLADALRRLLFFPVIHGMTAHIAAEARRYEVPNPLEIANTLLAANDERKVEER